MNFIKEYFEIIVIVLFVASFVLLITVISYNRYFKTYFLNKKFQISSNFTVNPMTGDKDFSIQIYNKNINDIRVAGFGYTYQGQNIDFYQNYLSQMNLPKEHRLVISSRDFLTAKIDMNLLKTIISDINKGEWLVWGMKAYVTDSQGMTTHIKAKQVKNKIESLLLDDVNEIKKRKREQRKKENADKKAFQMKIRQEKRIKRRERFGRIILAIKGKFNSLRKKKSEK